MHIIRGCIDDRFDLAVSQHGFIAWRRPAAVLGHEPFALLRRTAIAADDGELARALNRVSQNIGPPTHAEAPDTQRIRAHHFPPASSSLPARTNTLDCRLGDAQVCLPVASAHANPADAVAFDKHRYPALHGRPSFWPGRERKTDRVDSIQILPDCPLCARRTLI